MSAKGEALILLIAASLVLSGCGGKADGAYTGALNERIEAVGALYDAGDYRGAAERFSTLLSEYRQGRESVNEKTTLRDYVFPALSEVVHVFTQEKTAEDGEAPSPKEQET